MKILIVNTFYFPDEIGGAEKSVRFLAESLVQLGHEVRVLCLGDRESTEIIRNVTIKRVLVPNLYLPNPNSPAKKWFERFYWHLRDSLNFRATPAFLGALAEFSPDVVHTNNVSGFSTAIWRSCSALSIPVVHTTRDFYLICHKTTMMKGTQSCLKQCADCVPFSRMKGLHRSYVSHFVAISGFMRRKHLEYGFFVDTPGTVIYNSVDISSTRELRRSGRFVIGFIGRLDAAKGVETLIQAFRELLANDEDLSLVIAGTGRDAYVEKLKLLAEGLPITFLGKIAPEEFFSQIDLTIVPSLWEEPLGRVAIESIAFGRPVVVSPVGGLRELVDGISILGTRDVSVSSFIESIQEFVKVLKVDYERISEASLLRAKEFSGEVIARKYVEVYESVLLQGSPCNH